MCVDFHVWDTDYTSGKKRIRSSPKADVVFRNFLKGTKKNGHNKNKSDLKSCYEFNIQQAWRQTIWNGEGGI